MAAAIAAVCLAAGAAGAVEPPPLAVLAMPGEVHRGPLPPLTDAERRLAAAIEGVGWSDHWSFWQAGYPAVMVTDTAPFRYPHYHAPEDTPDKLDYERLARVVAGLERVVGELAEEEAARDGGVTAGLPRSGDSP